MFYIAFIIRDMDMLKTQLATMLIILQAINNVQEAILPLILKFYTNKVRQSSLLQINIKIVLSMNLLVSRDKEDCFW